MKNLTHLVRVQKTTWINPAHIVKIERQPTTDLQLGLFLTDGLPIKVDGDDAKTLLASLQAAD